MRYYHIQLSKIASSLYMIIFMWVKYRYKRLLMGVDNSLEIFQHKMNDLFHRFEFIRAFIDGLLVVTKGGWTYYVQNMELTINKLKEKILKFNIEKYFFGQTEMEYLGFWVTHDGVKPIDKRQKQ